MPPVSQVVAGIPPNVPLVFVDTCAYLDVIRFANRAGNLSDLAAAVGADALSGAAGQVVLLRADLVQLEFTSNVQTVLDEATRYVSRIDDDIQRLCDCENQLQPGTAPTVAPFAARGVHGRLRQLADSLLSKSVELTADTAARERAYDRQVRAIGPARKGKDCLKDCTIVEVLLDLAGQLRSSNGTNRLVFLSSNKDDFYDAAGGPHADLAADFAAKSIQLCKTWGFAKHSAGF